MLKSNLVRFVALGVAGLFATSGVAACSSDTSSSPKPPAGAAQAAEDPTITPEPQESSEPTVAADEEPTPIQGSDGVSVMMTDFPVTSTTTGSELFEQVSETESACLRLAMGDAGAEIFQSEPIEWAAAQQGTYEILADCLDVNNLAVTAVGLMSVKNDGWEAGSRECVTDVVTEHPELIYIAFGLGDQFEELRHPGTIHAEIVRLYECLTIEEQVIFNVVMRSDPVADFSGSHFLEVLPDAEFECIKESLSEDDFDDLSAEPDLFAGEDIISPQTQAQTLMCLSPETLAYIPRVLIMYNLGIKEPTSRACILDFFDENEDYIPLVVQVGLSAETLTPEEFTTIANDALRVFDCLSEDEILFFQENYLPLTVP